jgi:hypothetical protein
MFIDLNFLYISSHQRTILIGLNHNGIDKCMDIYINHRKFTKVNITEQSMLFSLTIDFYAFFGLITLLFKYSDFFMIAFNMLYM